MLNKEVILLEKELAVLRLEPAGSELVAMLNRLALASHRSDPIKSEAWALEALNLADELELPGEQARCYTTLGTINKGAGNFTEAMSYCRKSMKIYEGLEDIGGMASVQTTLASIYRAQGIFDKALEHYHEALRQYQECDGVSEHALAICHLNIGSCYSSLFHLDMAQSSYEFAAEIWEKSGDRQHMAYIYNNMGSLCGRKDDTDRALEYFNKALAIREDMGDKTGAATTLGNLGSLHSVLHENESALDFFTRSLELYEEIGNTRGVAYTCNALGGMHTVLGNLDVAEELIIKGLRMTRELHFKDWEILCLEETTKLYRARGDFQKALMYSRELITCLEEHLNEKSIEKIAALQVQFEIEKTEKEAEIYRLKNFELSSMNAQLREAFAQVKQLQGMFPICANCKKVRDDDGYWQQIESYISDHSDAQITHGICPECFIKLYSKDFTQNSL